MSTPVILVEAMPRRTSDGEAVTVRLAGGGWHVPYFYYGEHWRGGIVGLPQGTSSLNFDGEQLGGGGVANALEINWAPGSNTALSEMSGLYWADAPVTVRIGPEGVAIPPVDTTGLILDCTIEGGVMTLTLADATVDLKRPLLVDRYTGTGGIEGPAEWENKIKSRAWGQCFNVPGETIDPANNIICFGDPRRQWKTFVAVRDKGAPASADRLTLLAWQGSAEATFAALQAADPTDGGGVLCPAIACIKWWTEPGQLHADIEGETEGGYVETAPEIAARIIADRSALTIAAGELAAAIAARPAPFGWRVSDESTAAATEISTMLADVSLSWPVVAGEVVFRRWEWNAPVRAARSNGVSRREVKKPVAIRRLGYLKNQAPMQRGDLAGIVLASDVLLPTGETADDALANLTEAVEAFGNDAVIARGGEKRQTVEAQGRLVKQIAALNAQYAALGAPAALDAAKAAADAALATLNTYLGTLAPAWNDTDEDTPIVPATWATKWGDAETAIEDFAASITGRPGASAFTLVDVDNTVLTTNSVRGTGNGWVNKARTAESYRAAQISARLTVNAGFGLTTDPAVDNSYASVDYWFHRSSNGTLARYRNGVSFGLTPDPHADDPDTPYQASVWDDGTTVRYFYGDSELTAWAHPVNAVGENIYGVFNVYYNINTFIDQITVAPSGQSGQNAYVGYLTNEAVQLPASSAGVVSSYAGATGTFKVFAGASDVSASFALSTPSGGNPGNLTHAYSGQNYTVSANFSAATDATTLTIRATGSGAHAGVVIDKVFSLSKSKAGANGTSPALITLSGPQAATYDAGASYTGGDMAFTTLRTNSADTPVFTIRALDGTGLKNGTAAAIVATEPTGYSTTGPDTLTVAAAKVAALVTLGGGGFSVTSTVTGASDRVSVVKIKDGANGLNTALVYAFQRAESAPAAPSVATTYTFSTKSLTGLNNGWSAAIPSGANPLYVIAATASSATDSDTIASGEWSAPAVLAQNGSNGTAGLNSATAWLFKRAVSAPAVPASALTYTFATGALSGTLSGWTQTAPVNDGNPLYYTTATAAGVGATDTIATGEWAAVQVMAENGTSARSFDLSTQSITITANYDGTSKSGQFPKIVDVKVLDGSIDVTGSAAVTLTPSDSGAITAAYSGGTITISEVDAAGYINVSVTYAGIDLGTKRIDLPRNTDPQPPTSQTSQADQIGIGVSDSTYNAATGPLTLRASASGLITISGYADYQIQLPSGGGTMRLAAKGQYRIAGSSVWIDAGAEVVGTSSTVAPGGEPSNGRVSLNHSVTGLTPNSFYEARIDFRKEVGSASATTFAEGQWSLLQ